MIEFDKSPQCSHNRCLRCRDSHSDTWRRQMSMLFSLPGGDVNFDCPWGIPWTDGRPPSLMVKDLPAKGPMAAPAKLGYSYQKRPGGCGCGGRQRGADGSISIAVPRPEVTAEIDRNQCPDCTRKHLAQAAILLQESISGHPDHRILAVAHVAEAQAESRKLFPDLALKMEGEWKRMMSEKDYVPDLMAIIDEVTKRVSGGS